jgi:HD-GYP domain-containing protein (c-di-GMP phosphodiesterase class II)
VTHEKPRRRGRILTSLLLLLFAVGVAPLLGTSWQLVSRSREILEYDQKQSQLDTARNLSQQLTLYVQALQAHLFSMARTLEVESSADQFPALVKRLRETRGLERYLQQSNAFAEVRILDSAGQGVRAGMQPDQAVEGLMRDAWERGLQGESVISRPVPSAMREPVVVLSEPIFAGKQGEPEPGKGVVMAVAGLGPLWSMTQGIAQGGVMDVYVVDDVGALVAHSQRDAGKVGADLSGVPIVQKFLASKGRASSTEPFTMKGKDGRTLMMLGTFTRVPETGWGVIVQVDEDKAYYVSNQMGRQALQLVLLVTVLAITLGTVFAGQISRPIQALARGARRLAGGAYDTRVEVNSSNEVGLLASAFNHMGAEIQKAIEEVRHQALQNRQLFLGSIRMLANAIDEKDPYTRGHSERVAYYSMIMSRYLGMSQEEVERVHLSGLIHDVGKIGIEDKILRKAAALTDEEYEIMKQHPRKGEHILEAVPLLKEMAGAGLMHHENVDGSGYPDGLKGDAIPLLGRIVSVADAFDAMTTDRPYSKAMTFEAALARLRFLAGKKFDLTCVEAIEQASAAGDLTPAKARRAAIEARQVLAVPAAAQPAGSV